MPWRPQLNVICNRCGKPRGLGRHDCFGNSTRRATLKLKQSFGSCPKCRRPYGAGGQLTHICHPKSDFKRRTAAARRRDETAARKKRQQDRHDYQACGDAECPRPLCVAFKTGYLLGYRDGREDGYREGYDRGHRDGYDKGFIDGIASCPRPHAAS